MTLKQIIAQRLAELGLGPIEAATRGGLERNFIKDLLAGRKQSPRAESLRKLANALSLPLADLLSAERPEPTVISIEEAERNGQPSRPVGVSAATPYVGRFPGAIPEVDAKAGAGNGEVGRVIAMFSKGIETAHKVRAEWIMPVEFTRHALGADPRSTIILEVVGDSMRPTLEPGDRVLVDTSVEWRNDDSVWLIDDGTPKVKRLRMVRGSSPARVTILSDNQLIQPEEIDLDEIRVIGRVVGRVSRM